MDPDLSTPYGQQWSLQVQYELRPNWLLEVGYVGSNGVKLYSVQEANPAVVGPGANTGNTDFRRVLNQGHPQRRAVWRRGLRQHPAFSKRPQLQLQRPASESHQAVFRRVADDPRLHLVPRHRYDIGPELP